VRFTYTETMCNPDFLLPLAREAEDAGYDGFILTGEESGALLYQVVLGPYESVEAARDVADAVRAGFGLSPAVMVGEPLAGLPEPDELDDFEASP